MPHTVVAIPVRNEAALISDCLRAIALQNGIARTEVVLLINNTTDGTAGIVRDMLPVLPCRVHVIEHELPPGQSNAGHARRLAVEHALAIADPDGVVLTTDADSCVAPDWLEANLAALHAGADVVCGRAIIDPVDALRIPDHLHQDDALEVAYGAALDRIRALLDPDPADPWPRHVEESGASIAVRRASLVSAGGVPAVRLGEDRALVAALRRIDARVRHDPKIWVTVSGRTIGRATDGMADTIRRRIVQQDATLDDTLESLADRMRRVGACRLLRLAWNHHARRAEIVGHLASELDLSRDVLEGWLAFPHFGAAWAMTEAISPALTPTPVQRCDAGAQLLLASNVISRLEAGRQPIAGTLKFGKSLPPMPSRQPPPW